MHVPLAADHSRTSWSLPAEISTPVLPSHATLFTPAEWPRSTRCGALGVRGEA